MGSLRLSYYEFETRYSLPDIQTFSNFLLQVGHRSVDLRVLKFARFIHTNLDIGNSMYGIFFCSITLRMLISVKKKWRLIDKKLFTLY